MEQTIKELEKIFGIKCPNLMQVAILYEAYSKEYDNRMIQAQPERVIPEDIPEDAEFIAAYYIEETETLILAHNTKFDDKFVKLSNEDIIFTLSHELRHVWQKENDKEKYFQTNAVNMEVINDISEIDADAFAMAYCWALKTLNERNMNITFEQMVIQGTLDGGKRYNKALELANEYNFPHKDNLLKTIKTMRSIY